MPSGNRKNGGDRLDRFREIARERVRSLDVWWTQLEVSANPETGVRLTGELHTLKGDAGMMGFSRLAELIHAMEDIAQLAQRLVGRGNAQAAIFELGDSFADGVSWAQRLIDADPDSDEHAEPVSELLERMRAAIQANAAGDSGEPGEAGESGEASEPVASEPVAGEPGDAHAVPRPVEPSRSPVPKTGPVRTIRPAPGELDGEHEGVARSEQAAAEPGADEGKRAFENYAVRVNPMHLDRMRDIIGELLLAKTRLAVSAASLQVQRERGVDHESRSRTRAHEDVLRSIESQLRDDMLRIGSLVTALDEVTRDLRMVSISVLFQRYPRAVRNLSRTLGRRVQLVTRGEAVEADREVLEALEAPLLHLVNNALDHGIEAPQQRVQADKPEVGTLTLSASVVGDSLHLTVTDDGAGIDVEKVRARAVERGVLDPAIAPTLPEASVLDCLFVSGMTLRDTVSTTSGRGVGLDVVHKTVRSLGGSIELSSELGVGTQFHLTAPIRAAITSVLLFRVGVGRYAIPTSSLVAIENREEHTLIETLDGPAWDYHGVLVPLLSLAPILEETPPPSDVDHETRVIIARHGGGLVGLTDTYNHEQREVVLKSAGRYFSEDRLIAAGFALEEGSVALVINPDEAYRIASGRRVVPASVEPVVPSGPRTVLVAEDSPVVRDLIADALRAHGLTVIEAVDGQDALEKLRDNPDVRLLVTDVEMPRMDGLTLISRMRAIGRRRIPAVVVSTRGSPEDKLAAVEVGADHYLVKNDYSSEGLWTIVSRFLG